MTPTIRKLLTIDDAELRRGAEVILAKELQTDASGLVRALNKNISAEVEMRFQEKMDRRMKGEPLAYIVEEKEFYSMPFFVDHRVLIPRPETELVVESILGEIRSGDRKHVTICDVGTGSGAIALTLKKWLPQARIIGIDQSRDALEVARINAQRLHLEVTWRQGNLLSEVNECVDVVAANLPYISTLECETIDTDVRDYEPRQALDGGSDGLLLIRSLIEQVESHTDVRLAVFEVGIGQAERVVDLLTSAGFANVEVRADLSDIPRVVVARKERRCP